MENVFLRSADRASACTLEEVALEQARSIVLERKEAATKGVRMVYPAHLPLESVLEHPSVSVVERSLYNAVHERLLPPLKVRLLLQESPPAVLISKAGEISLSGDPLQIRYFAVGARPMGTTVGSAGVTRSCTGLGPKPSGR